MSDTYIIAEVGSNHAGDLAPALAAIDIYADLGASAVKFQWTSDAAQMASRRGAPELADTYERYLQWPRSWHERLATSCGDLDTDYMCTVYLPEDVEVVAPHVARFKVASFEARDPDLAEAHAFISRRPIYISTGAMGPNEFHPCAGLWSSLQGRTGLLHCTSAYPAPLESLNLAAMREGPYVGLSDHTDPGITITGALAVAAGARVIEAHVRVPGQSPDLPDYGHAMEPSQFEEYVRYIRTAEIAMGDPVKRLQECERPMAAYRVE